MKQAIGMTQIMNYIMIFIAITFCFLIATLGYMKAFKVNSKIADAVEKFEGYNELSKEEIKRVLNILGYKKGNATDCGAGYISDIGYNICIQEMPKTGNYFKYKIKTFVEFGPILGFKFQIPITSESEKIYYFSD